MSRSTSSESVARGEHGPLHQAGNELPSVGYALVTLVALVATLIGASACNAAHAESPARPQVSKPMVVLVHGAFADGSSWNGVIKVLESDGYAVVAVANPLRGVQADADSVSAVVASLNTPVVLVGHSYGGCVISQAAASHNVKALVFVSAFAPEVGETAAQLSGEYPGSTLAMALAPPVSLSGGGSDLYAQQDKFAQQFAADVPLADAKLMAAGQRPITQAALGEVATNASWKSTPSWFIYGDQDRNIPPAALKFMADRAQSRKTVVIRGGSHLMLVSQPRAVADLIETAARPG